MQDSGTTPPILAEIADKMSPIGEFVVMSCVVAAVLSASCMLRWWLGFIVLPLTLVPIYEFVDDQRTGFGQAVFEEMGVTYYVTDFLARSLPLVAVAVTSMVARGFQLRASRSRAGLCVSCTYDLAGNVSGVCPECGERI